MRLLPHFRLAGREPTASQDVEAEIGFHLTEATELLVAQGWNEAEAREEAKRRFGDIERLRKGLREMDEGTRRRWHWRERFDGVRQDIVYALRGLKRSPGFAAVVIVTLGLAIGANATMFRVVDRLLLRPPDEIPNAEQVRRITVARWIGDRLSDPWDAISYPSFTYLRDGTKSFEQVAVMNSSTMSYGLGQEAKPVRTVNATGQYFEMLGTQPVLGRFFGEPEDQEPDGIPVAVLSYGFWQSTLGGKRDILGQSIRLDGHLFEVIGVAPRGFTGTNLQPVDVWIPIHSVARFAYGPGQDWATQRGWQFLNAYVRLRPGVSDAGAASDATRAYQLGHADYQGEYERRAVPYLGSLIAARTRGASEGSDAQVATWLLGVAAMVLLIACANVANLVLARGARRKSEVAVRLALGVPRRRLLRMLLTESLLLAIAGAGLGLVLARWGGQLLAGLLLPGIAWETIGLDRRLLLVTTGLTVFVALVAGLLPLLRATRTDLAAALHGASRQVGGAPLRLRAGLLLVQTTLCTALLVGAGLFLRSLDRVTGLDLGIRTDRALLVTVDLGAIGMSPTEQMTFYRQAQERLAGLRGVAAVGAIQCAPFMCNSAEGIRVPGVDSISRLSGGGPYYFRTMPGTLEALGVRLVRGRLFNQSDRAGSPPVTVISERMANTVWPRQDPIGKCFYAGDVDRSTGQAVESEPCREVIGVVADIHRQGLIEEPFMLYFTLIDQWADPVPPGHIIVATDGVPPVQLADAVRRELQSVRPDLPYIQTPSYEDVVSPQRRSWRLGATMFALFAGLSLLIAAVGLYGVLSYLVSQRTAELGIRAALGATPRSLLQMVLRNGLAVALGGVGLGLLLVVLVSGKLGSLLFETSPREPIVLGLAGALVVGVAGVASLIPGFRATRVDPMQALRAE